MTIIDVKLTDLKPYEKNPRHNEEAVKYVAKSIKQFGFKVPIIIDKNNVIVAGHTRYKAGLELGMETVPCIIADDLTPKQIKAFRLADNKVAEKSYWDFDLLNQELEDLKIDFNMSDFGFNFDENLPFDDSGNDGGDVEGEDDTEIQEDDFDTEEEIDKIETPITQLGDIYKLGNHVLMCGDSTDSNNIEKLMNGEKADMILSDPPYGMFLNTDFSGIKGSLKSIGRKNHTSGNKYEKVIGDNEDFSPKLITTFFDNFGYCKECFLFGADYFAELLPEKNKGSWLVWDKRKESQADAIGSEFELIWSKNKHKRRMLRHDWFGFLSSENSEDARNRVHPTQKPITLLCDIIKQWGNNCNIIVDLFGGSGSTLIACEKLGYSCRMMELEPKYCDVIIKRWEKLTGKKAEKLN